MPTPFEIGGFAIAAVSLVGSVGIPFWLSAGAHKLTEAQLDELDRQRRDEDEEKNRERVAADERRNNELREQLNALSQMNVERFKQWQTATEDLDDLWSFVEDELLPYTRTAYARIRGDDPDFPRPPQLRRRHDRLQ